MKRDLDLDNIFIDELTALLDKQLAADQKAAAENTFNWVLSYFSNIKPICLLLLAGGFILAATGVIMPSMAVTVAGAGFSCVGVIMAFGFFKSPLENTCSPQALRDRIYNQKLQ